MQKARRHPERIIGLRPLVSVRFQVLFHSPNRGSFHLSLALLCTIGHRGVLSLTGWSPWIHARFHETGATRDCYRTLRPFAYEAVTRYGAPFQTLRLDRLIRDDYRIRLQVPRHPVRNALRLHVRGLGSSLFAHRYWGSRCFFPFLRVLRWVSSPRSPRQAMHSPAAHGGLLHAVAGSRIPPDQSLLAAPRGFSQLSHVLLRLSVPRHPHAHFL